MQWKGGSTMTRLDVARAREEFEATIQRVVDGKERVVFTRDGKPVAVLAPIIDEELPPPDPAWQQALDEAVAQIRSGIPADVTPAEIEADITAASEEVRQERLARGR
jgi:antitoxin (DNA-binding transcriptional repressor) of toxin-antitoxin stability system